MASKVSSRAQNRPGKQAPAAPSPPKPSALLDWLRTHSMAAFLILTAIATVRIVATYSVFDHTPDEVGHIAVGMEYLDKGIYQMEWQHPPLARVAAALGPYLAGVRSQHERIKNYEGAAILNAQHNYGRNLALARLGIVPFFWIAALVAFLWARRSLGDLAALIAVFLFTFLPPVLAHAGLATTDMALTAFVGASLFTGLIWLEKPTPVHGALVGASVGLAVLSKFSALAFIPVAIAGALICYIVLERPGVRMLWAAMRARLVPFCLAILAGAIVIWAGYRFTFGQVPYIKSHLSLPAPELFGGIQEVAAHDQKGHQTYFLGQTGVLGWWYYYPIVLAVKTPLPFLALLGLGALLSLRKPRQTVWGAWLALAFSMSILLFSMTSRINIGVRHVLPVYIGFSIVAAAGAIRLLDLAPNSRWAHWTLLLLLGWSAATSLLSHPDYIPYFNALAGSEPEKIVVDSDLDWGQDMKRLGRRLKEVGAREVTFLPLVETAARGYPPIHGVFREVPSPGWNAVSLTRLKAERLGLYNDHPEIQVWPERFQPTERIGKGILLYYFPPQ